LGLLHPALGLRADAFNSLTSPVVGNGGADGGEVVQRTVGSGNYTSESKTAGTSGTPADESTPSNFDEPVTRAEINGLAGDINELRDDMNFNYQRLTANTKRPVTIDGLLQTRYTFRDDGNKEYPDQFSVPFANLTALGSLYTDYASGHNLNFSLGLQYGAVGYVPVTYTTTANANTAFSLADGYLAYVILPIVDPTKPQLVVQFGQQQKPYGVEPQVADSLKPTINPANWAGPTGFNFSGRDIGLQVIGDLLPNEDFGNNYRVAAITYQAGVFNGNGANTSFNATPLAGGGSGSPGTPGGAAYNGSTYSYGSATQDHPVKDLYGRLAFNAPVDYNNPWRGLTIGSSIYQDHTPVVLSPGAFGANPKGLPNEEAETLVYGGDVTYANVPVGFTAEYAHGEIHNLESVVGHAAEAQGFVRSADGLTATLFYEFGQQFNPDYINQTKADDYYPKTYQFFVRGDYWNPNTGLGIGPNAVTEATAGFNAFFASTTKFQINYQARKDGDGQLRSDQYLAQFQYGF
jgi:hypothetical protein